MTDAAEKHKCSARHAYGLKTGYHPECSIPAKFFENDQWYCWRHAPSQRDKAVAIATKRNQKWNRENCPPMVRRRYGREALDVLRQIADGHNDARTLAKETLEKMEKDLARAEAGEYVHG